LYSRKSKHFIGVLAERELFLFSCRVADAAYLLRIAWAGDQLSISKWSFLLGGKPQTNFNSPLGKPHTTKREMNQKDEPRTGFLIHLRSGAIGKKIFTSIEL
jgi:hypothetical protein